MNIQKRRRRDGSVAYRVRISDATGKTMESATFDSLREARTWGREREQAICRAGGSQRYARAKIPLRKACERYIREVTAHKKGAIKERQRFAVLFADAIMDMPMAEIRGDAIAAFRDRRLAKVKPSTVNRDLNLLGHVFSVAIADWSFPIQNPVQAIRRPRVPAQYARKRRLKGDEEQRLLSACANDQDLAAAIRLALETGMRRGELIRLTWDCVDLKKRIIRLPDSKTGAPRNVPLSTAARQALATMPRRIDGQVFGYASGDALTMAFRRACKLADIEDLRFHDLRHEATSRFFEKGLNPMQVAAITGHKTLQMLSRYTHLRAEDLAKMLG